MAGELPREFPKDTELTSDLIDTILRELWRWRHAQAAGDVGLDHADSDEPPLFHSLIDSGIVLPAVNGSAEIAGGTVTAPTAFAATLLVPLDDGPGMTFAGGDGVTAYNQYPGTIGASSLIYLVRSFGYYYVLTSACS